jgi:hypothetical protein
MWSCELLVCGDCGLGIGCQLSLEEAGRRGRFVGCPLSVEEEEMRLMIDDF